MSAQLVDHPDRPDLWRHEPPMWGPCSVCGGPTCWAEMDIAFMHPECDMYPSEEGDVRMVLGVKTSRREQVMALKSYDEMNAEQQLAYKLGAASLTPADVLAAVRTLPGVTTAETVMDHKQFRSWYIPMDEPGTYLLVPLSEEE